MTDNKSRSYFKYPDLKPNVSEATVRASYKVLALQQHPDKADEADRPQATAAFQELQNTCEHCLSQVETRATVEEDPEGANGEGEKAQREFSGCEFWDTEGKFSDEEEDEDQTSDWRGRLPEG